MAAVAAGQVQQHSGEPLDPSGWRAVEDALVHHFHERGVEVSADDARLAVARSLDRFREVRVRQYVSIFVMRDACEWLRQLQAAGARGGAERADAGC